MILNQKERSAGLTCIPLFGVVRQIPRLQRRWGLDARRAPSRHQVAAHRGQHAFYHTRTKNIMANSIMNTENMINVREGK
jgi:hypothetical protein